MKKHKITGEVIVDFCLLVLATLYLGYTLSNYPVGSARSPKEGFMPLIAGAGAVLTALYLTVQAARGKGDAKEVKLRVSFWRFLALTAASLLYAFALRPLGYVPASFLFLLFVFKTVGLKGWTKPVLISALAALVFWFVFRSALGVMLPPGLMPV